MKTIEALFRGRGKDAAKFVSGEVNNRPKPFSEIARTEPDPRTLTDVWFAPRKEGRFAMKDSSQIDDAIAMHLKYFLGDNTDLGQLGGWTGIVEKGRDIITDPNPSGNSRSNPTIGPLLIDKGLPLALETVLKYTRERNISMGDLTTAHLTYALRTRVFQERIEEDSDVWFSSYRMFNGLPIKFDVPNYAALDATDHLKAGLVFLSKEIVSRHQTSK